LRSGWVYTVPYSTVRRERGTDSIVAESLLTENYLFKVARLLSRKDPGVGSCEILNGVYEPGASPTRKNRMNVRL